LNSIPTEQSACPSVIHVVRSLSQARFKSFSLVDPKYFPLSKFSLNDSIAKFSFEYFVGRPGTVQIAFDLSEPASTNSQGFSQTLIDNYLPSLFFSIVVKPLAVISYLHPPSNEHLRADELADTTNAFLYAIDVLDLIE